MEFTVDVKSEVNLSKLNSELLIMTIETARSAKLDDYLGVAGPATVTAEMANSPILKDRVVKWGWSFLVMALVHLGG